MDAIELLETQHSDIDALFARLEKGGGQARQQIFDDLADLLAIHALHRGAASSIRRSRPPPPTATSSTRRKSTSTSSASSPCAWHEKTAKFAEQAARSARRCNITSARSAASCSPRCAGCSRRRSAGGARAGDDVDDGRAAEGPSAARRAAADDGADAVGVAAGAGRDRLARDPAPRAPLLAAAARDRRCGQASGQSSGDRRGS